MKSILFICVMTIIACSSGPKEGISVYQGYITDLDLEAIEQHYMSMEDHEDMVCDTCVGLVGYLVVDKLDVVSDNYGGITLDVFREPSGKLYTYLWEPVEGTEVKTYLTSEECKMVYRE